MNTMVHETPGGSAREHRCGYVTILGLPNAGKSTLMNRFISEKVSIVSPKPQTTRINVTSILSAENHQVIFIDTPGILKPRYKMQEVMASFIGMAIDEADVLLFLIDASHPDSLDHPGIVTHVEKTANKNRIVALNKIDIVKKHQLIPMMEKAHRLFAGAEIFPISALDGEGTDELFSGILDFLPAGPKLFPDDILSNEPERFFVSEFIREAVFLTMEQEIPYATAVVIDSFEKKEGKTVIYASILIEKDSHKPILVGKKGASIRTIGTQARLAIEEFLGTPVYLDLHVKVRKDWRRKDVFLREAGLFPRMK